jgi:BMFP domain-containing protein YqiC
MEQMDNMEQMDKLETGFQQVESMLDRARTNLESFEKDFESLEADIALKDSTSKKGDVSADNHAGWFSFFSHKS